MSSIDERVVNMKFNNSEFEQGVKSTIDSLAQLQKSLQLSGASRGLDQVSATAKGFTLSHIGAAVDSIRKKFESLSVIGIAALVNLTNQAVNSAIQIGKAFTFGPISAGFENYETQINAIRTILSNTGLTGKKGLKQVNAVLKQLNTYANQTVYNFSEMAKNIGTFTAAGVKLKPAANAIKGIANLAALSGANSGQASSAMYQLSQAIAANQVHLQDWNSVVNAGIGGKVFQNALFNTGQALHTIKNADVGESFQQWTKAGNTFRTSLQSGWITGKVLTDTLQGFTGDLTKAQLKAMGYNAQQVKQIQTMGKTAVNAATKIKTMTQLTQALKEEVATAYSAVFKTIFGNINQATKLFSKVHTSVENALTKPIYAFNKVLEHWSKLGGRTLLFKGLLTGLHDIEAVLKPIHDAFREIFPAQTGKSLLKLTQSFADFMSKLKIGAETANNLKRTFAGVFAVLDIGWQVLKQGIKFIADLFGAITKGEGSGGFGAATANVGDFLVALDTAVKKGQGLTKFFQGLEHILAGPIKLLKTVSHALLSVFNFKAPSAGGIEKTLNPLNNLGQAISAVWSRIITIFERVWHVFEPLAVKLGSFFSHIGTAISTALGGFNYENFLHTIDTGLFGGLLVIFNRFTKKFVPGGRSPIGAYIEGLTTPLESLTGVLESMEKALQAAILLQIAAAIGIMTLSLIGLSAINPKDLARALSAISVMFVQLFTALKSFDAIGGAEGLAASAGGLILLSTALRVLTSSVVKLSKLSWKQLSTGLTGVSGLLVTLVATTRGMVVEAPGMIASSAALILMATAVRVLVNSVTKLSGLTWGQMSKGLTGVATLLASLALYSQFTEADAGGILAGTGLILLATSIKILSGALKNISKLSWGQLAKGLTGLAGSLVAIAAAMNLMPATSILSGAAVLIVAASLGMISKALSKMSDMSWGQIAKGIVALAGALVIIAGALNLIPPTSLLSAGAIFIVATALGMIGSALTSMAGMSWGQIAKGLVTLAGALGIIAVAMAGMTSALLGAAALVVVAAALTILVPVIELLGNMSWSSIVKGLTALAGVFLVLGAAGIVLTPLVPTLLGLGLALTLIGAGIGLAGAGVLAFASGMAALAISGTAAAASIVAIVSSVLGLLPLLVKQLALMMVAFAESIAEAVPALLHAATVLIMSLLKAIDTVGPQIINTFFKLLQDLLKKLQNNAPRMAREALNTMIGILKAMKNKEPEIVNLIITMVIKLLDAMSKRAGEFSKAAANFIVKFIAGISKNLDQIVTSGVDLIIAFIKGIGSNAVKIANAALDTIVTFINGLSAAIETHVRPLRTAGEHMAFAIADGLTLGLASKSKHVVGSIVGLGKSMLGGFASKFGISSPSKVMRQMGRFIDTGLAQGLIGGKDDVKAAWEQVHQLLHTAVQDSASDIKSYESKLKELGKDHTKNAAAIKKVTDELARARKEHKLSVDTLGTLHDSYSKEEADLESLGKIYDKLTAKLEKANQTLKDAKQTRDDYDKTVKDELNVVPDIAPDTQLKDFENADKEQLASIKKFADVLQQLRKEGLGDSMYKILLSKGVDALPLAEEILAGGKSSINEVNNLTGEIHKAAKALGDTASKSLYQAGVNAAQGVVDGLKAQRKGIEKVMQEVADAIVKSLKKSLKIKSPSEVMHELGEFVTKGLANGIEKSIAAVTNATSFVGNTAVDAMKKSLSALSTAVSGNIDVTPTIAPVLDLSEIRKGSAMITDLLSQQPITIDSTYSKARYASVGYQANRDSVSDSNVPVLAPGDITFIQNNTSPKALSSAEIYRQTKNQLSIAKGALKKDAA